MPVKEKTKRNKDLVRRRIEDRSTFRALARFYNLDVKSVYRIWKRDKNKYEKEIKKLSTS